MKALVTGASGFVGGHLVEKLKKEGIDVTALVRESSDIRLLKEQGIQLAYGDLQDKESLDKALEGITHLFHCGAVVSDWADPKLIEKINIEGTQTLLDLSLKHKIKRFVHVSSLAVLGMHDHFQTNESAPYEKTGDSYCDTKIEAEKRVLQAYKEKGLPTVIVRPGFIYGPRDRQFLPRVFKFLKAGKFIYIGDGQKILNLTNVKNLIDAILLAAKSDSAIGQVYNVTDDGKVTRKRLIETICDVADLPKPTKSIPLPVAKLLCSACETYVKITKSKKVPLLNRARMKFLALNLDFDISKIRKELNYEPKVDLKKGMEETIDWFQSSGKWNEL